MFSEHRGVSLFRFLGVEVSVSLWYGILMGFVAILWPSMGSMTYADGVIVALAITLSLLVHEYAHALMAKRYNLSPSIILHAFGGYCATDREARTDGEDARVVLAGPIAGLVFAGLIGLVYLLAPGIVAASPVTQTLFAALLWVNLVWSAVNLVLPIWPLDGGRLFHLLLRRFTDEKKARRWVLNASIYTVVPVGILGLMQFGNLLLIFFAFYVLMDNIRALKADAPLVHRKSSRSRREATSLHEDLLVEAEEAMKHQDWSEAARLAHHMRSLGSMPGRMLNKVWMILGIATMKLGDHEQALQYLQRAPKKSKVKRAIRRCEDEINDHRATN